MAGNVSVNDKCVNIVALKIIRKLFWITPFSGKRDLYLFQGELTWKK